MGNYLIQQCACSENKFTEVYVQRLSASRSKVIVTVLKQELKALQVQGLLQIVEIGGLIVSAIYDYANEQEVERSEEICKKIQDVFFDLDDDIERACQAKLIDVF